MTRSGIAVLLAIVALGGCGRGPVASGGDVTTSPSPSALIRPAPTASAGQGPPEATLSAEGGDPVPGQPGSYTWNGTGSDSPWLPGAPITVGVGESLSMTLAPPTAIGTWRARYVPAEQTDADGARPLGEGSTRPTFPAPPAGRWTVEVQITVPVASGTASYFWRIDVD